MPAQTMQQGLAISSARSIQREDTRRRLLACARQQFRSVGVEPVAMEDIASAAAVSRATVYLHFAGKPALLRALLEEDWASQKQLFERLRKVDFADGEDVAGWVRRVAAGMRVASDSFAIHRAALGQNSGLTVRHQQHLEELAKILCAAAGVKPARRRLLEAELIVAEIEHFATASVVGWSEEDTAMAVQLVVARLWTYASGS